MSVSVSVSVRARARARVRVRVKISSPDNVIELRGYVQLAFEAACAIARRAELGAMVEVIEHCDRLLVTRVHLVVVGGEVRADHQHRALSLPAKVDAKLDCQPTLVAHDTEGAECDPVAPRHGD